MNIEEFNKKAADSVLEPRNLSADNTEQGLSTSKKKQQVNTRSKKAQEHAKLSEQSRNDENTNHTDPNLTNTVVTGQSSTNTLTQQTTTNNENRNADLQRQANENRTEQIGEIEGIANVEREDGNENNQVLRNNLLGLSIGPGSFSGPSRQLLLENNQVATSGGTEKGKGAAGNTKQV
ncbi:uncharacterized protein MELLADRAFT_116166 [Melampsora larici-populina 98AG31]|uniref:Uncharacterized protein n=1 Tax=Melampsora larici-populina (strain 98AG31 / pathotype 3-4-7) TaxID=747676 RepID=F4RIB7_MELLP|nr:uncharacterized protein MELLADRAFT_116166 [Melampsora larici-populina 98AG31]EGG07978.1 hypothetical protein MELLADRAFT_116166 [Melampsora larici-populina 98AG31]